MNRAAALAVAATLWAGLAFAQGIANDLLAGKLVDPEVGQWAWYDLTDKVNGKVYAIRQAIVASEKVDSKTGYWVELEIVPQVGYKNIFRMLVTGPASDPRNIHKVIQKTGPEPAEIVEIPDSSKEKRPEAPRRKSLGMEDVSTMSGVLRAERLSLSTENRTLDMWVSEAVKPSGVVRVVSPEGEMLLRAQGVGGTDGRSVIAEFPIPDSGQPIAKPKEERKIERGKRKLPEGEKP